MQENGIKIDYGKRQKIKLTLGLKDVAAHCGDWNRKDKIKKNNKILFVKNNI